MLRHDVVVVFLAWPLPRSPVEVRMEPPFPFPPKKLVFLFFFFEREKSFHDRERVEQKKKNARVAFLSGAGRGGVHCRRGGDVKWETGGFG